MPKREENDRDLSPPLKPIQRNQNKASFYEKIWKTFTFITVPLSLILFKDILVFEEWTKTNVSPRADLSDLWLTATAFIVIYILRKAFQRALYGPVYTIIEDKHQGEERVERTKRVVKWMYDVMYYGSLTCFVFLFFRDANFLPPTLFGSGECSKLYSEFPELPKVPYLKQYYLIQLGSHFCSVFEQVMFKRKDLKFYEYFLHHYLAFTLIFFSYLTQMWALGSMVLITHDISDIFLAFARAFEGQKHFKSQQTVVYGVLGLTAFMWAYCRTFVFPVCAIQTCFVWWREQNELNLPVWLMIKHEFTFEVSLLVVLLLMNIYWVFILTKMFVMALTKKGVENDYDPKLLKKN